MGKEVEFVVSGVSSGKGTRWNYQTIAEAVEKLIRNVIRENIDEARKIVASTSKYARAKLCIGREKLESVAKQGKTGELPSYDTQVYHIKEAIKQYLGLKTRREGEDIVIYLTPSDIQRYLNEVEE